MLPCKVTVGLWDIAATTLSRKKTITIVLAPANDRLLSRAARERGVSRPEFVRQHLALVLAQYRRQPKPQGDAAARRGAACARSAAWDRRRRGERRVVSLEPGARFQQTAEDHREEHDEWR
jgi:hypothetical protein